MKKTLSKLIPVALLPLALWWCFNKENNNVQPIQTGNINTWTTNTQTWVINELTWEWAEIMNEFNNLINWKETQSYLNGKYDINELYATPAGQQTVKAAITVENNIVKTVSIDITAKDDISKKFQTKFKEWISGKIVWKNIDDVDVKFVNWSSLTATAFNNALSNLSKSASK